MPSAKATIDELLALLPETDKQIEARQPAPPPDAPKQKREPDPDPGAKGSKFTAPDPELAERLVQQLLAGGRKSLVQLIGRIRDVSDRSFDDYRAEYLLHCAVLHAGSGKGAKHRKLLADVLADQIESKKLSLGVREALVHELQWVGNTRAVDKLGSLLLQEQLCDAAAGALLALGADSAPAFRKAFSKSSGRARLVVVQGLAQLRDGKSVQALRAALADKDADVRLCAAWGLARLGDTASTEKLLALASGSSAYRSAKATQACLLLAENVAAAGRKADARAIYRAIRDRSREEHIRDATSKAIAELERT